MKERRFYAGLPAPALVGIETSGHSQWFEKDDTCGVARGRDRMLVASFALNDNDRQRRENNRKKDPPLKSARVGHP